MELKIFKNYGSLSAHVCSEIIELIKRKPEAVLCLASGDTPRLTCELTAARALEEKVDFSKSTFIGLDEWVGVPPSNKGSCHYFFEELLLKPLGFTASQIHLFDGMADDLAAECSKMDQVIMDHGGVDLMIVGIGMNGHIGFNEPGVSFDNGCHFIELDQQTVEVGQKYFREPVPLRQGITIGLKHLMATGRVFLLANGSKKSAVIREAVEGPVVNSFPASILQTHAGGFVLIDQEAAALLTKK